MLFDDKVEALLNAFLYRYDPLSFLCAENLEDKAKAALAALEKL